MFGIIPANRACLTNFVTVSPTQFAFSFPSSPHFSHLVVFILPGNTIPPGTAAGVHIQLPGSAQYKFLGAIGNEKPSAFFKVNLPGQQPLPGGTSGGEPGICDINLGISVEPITSIQAQLVALESQSQPALQLSAPPDAASSAMLLQRPPPRTKELAQRIIKNAFNFLASFAGESGPGGQEVVPLRSFQDWWTKFERRVESDPGFLERDEGE
jgi:protein Hikeshi